MKVIYVPVVIPVNLRTFSALVLCLLGALLIVVGVSTQSWFVIELHVAEVSTFSRVAKVFAYQGLQFVDVFVCRRSTHFKGDFCESQHVVYTQCDDATDTWCVGRVGFLTTFAAGIAASVVAFLSVGVGFVRELKHGVFAAVAAAAAVVGLVAYVSGYQASVKGGLLISMQQTAESDGASIAHSLGYSFWCYACGAVSIVAGAAVSLSLRCCAAHGDENRAFAEAPKIQMLHIDASNATTIATVAPQPGFVQLSAGRHVPDDDDDLITEIHPSELSSASVGGTPLRREETQQPTLHAEAAEVISEAPVS